MSKGQRVALGLSAVIALAVGGFFVFERYSSWRAEVAAQDAAFREARKLVAEQTAGAQTFISYIYADTEITFAQLFDRTDDRLKKIGDALVTIQAGELNEDDRKILSDYLTNLQEALQAEQVFYRKGLSLSSSSDALTSVRSDYASSPYNEYSDRWERKRVTDALKEASKAQAELQESVEDLGKRLVALHKFLRDHNEQLAKFSVVEDTVLKQAIAKNAQTAKS